MKKKSKKIKNIIVSGAVTLCGMLLIPPLIKKFGNKMYKKSLSKETINFDDIGPEI